MLRRLTLLLACACLGGCAGDRTGRLWVAGDMVHLTEQTPAKNTDEVWDAATRRVSLFSAANEAVSFQLVFDAPPAGAEMVKVSVGPLGGVGERKIGTDNIRLFRMLPAVIDRYPAWYLRLADGPVRPTCFYDALEPVEPAQSFKVGPNERLALWADVEVPRDALPGQYAGAITVRSDGRTLRAKVSLKVYNFVLPDARPVACIGGFSHETIFAALGFSVPVRLDATNKEVHAALTVIRQLMCLAHDHRLDLFDKTIHPVIKRDLSGAVVLRWGDYDNIVKPYLDGTAFGDRIGVAAWPAPFRLGERTGWPVPANYGGTEADAYRKTASAVLADTAKHFKALGFGDRLFVWPRTGRSDRSAYAGHAALARLVRSAAPELPILTELPPNPPARTGWTPPKDFETLADMYAPPAHLLAPADAARLGRGGHLLGGLWLRPGRPPYLGGCGPLSSPADVRALAWLAMKYDCPGIFLPEVLNWSKQAGGGEDRLFYPVADGSKVLPSVRLKRLRRGLQDAAYLWLLRQRQREAVGRIMTDTMVHYCGLDAAGDHWLDARLDGWVADGDVWVAARKLLAEEVVAAVHPQNVSSHRLLAAQLAWKRLQQRACRVRIERVRSRVDAVAGGRFRAVVRAELYNERTHPVEVELSIASLPAGWQAVAGRFRRRLAGGELVVAELSAEGSHIPTGPNARMNIPLTLTTNLRRKEDLTAQVPFIAAGLAKDAIVIDGDLSDWPLREGNTAADFIVLGRRGRLGKGLARRQTAVFANYDEQNLYLAFRCDEPNPEKTRARTDNIIHYEQLLAAGEDMVEVIVDPGRTAKSAADLYHLVAKCNGVVVTERGVGGWAGLAAPWPVRAQVAVARSKKLWVVEMAIPLKAFGAGAASPIWGINFTRFATADAEASSWAGATRYFYSPKNLGTIYLAPKKE